MSDKDYNASSIKALSQHDHLLKRLSLTFGPIESSGETFSRQKNVALRERHHFFSHVNVTDT